MVSVSGKQFYIVRDGWDLGYGDQSQLLDSVASQVIGRERGRRGGYKGVVAFVDELEKDVHALREPEESIIIGTMIVSVKY